MTHDMTRQHKTTQDKATKHNTGQDKTVQARLKRTNSRIMVGYNFRITVRVRIQG